MSLKVPDEYEVFVENAKGLVAIHKTTGEAVIAKKRVDRFGNHYTGNIASCKGLYWLETNPPPGSNLWVERLLPHLMVELIRKKQKECGLDG